MGFTLSQSNAQVKNGSYSLKVEGATYSQQEGYQRQYITTLPGEAFYVSGWVYCTVAPTTGNFYVKLYDETGTALIEESQISATTSGWRKVAFYADAPASCVKMSLRVGGNVKGGTCYFDGASCKRLRVKDYS